jgi:hypothetical protein
MMNESKSSESGKSDLSGHMSSYASRVFIQHGEVAAVARLLAAEGYTEAATFLVEKLKQQYPLEKYLHGLYGRIVTGAPERMQEEIKLIEETPLPPSQEAEKKL